MAEFTYELPSEKSFFKTLVTYLEYKHEKNLLNVIRSAEIKIFDMGTFSGGRWNARSAKIIFYVPIGQYELVNYGIKEKLRFFCNEVMPDELGFDVKKIEFNLPLLSDTATDPIQEIEDATKGISENIIHEFLPSEIKEKGIQMAEVYVYLYCIENSLRLFIDKVAREHFGDNYYEKVKLTREIKDNVKSRKQKESKNKWLSLRGDSEIFYLDFNDLSKIIVNNWEIFKAYFPSQQWITTKIEEMSECRHLIAHNSFVKEHDINVLKVNYTSILRQIDSCFRQ